MLKILQKKTIVADAKEFESQYEIAKRLIFKYLEVWFQQIFSNPKWKDIFTGKPNMHIDLAAEVLRNLLSLDETRSLDELNETVILAKKHASKWSDDVMNMDKEFCEFVIQTIRMDMIFHQYLDGEKWLFENPRGKRVSEILTRYGGKVPESPSPKKYQKILKKFMQWNEITEKKDLDLIIHN